MSFVTLPHKNGERRVKASQGSPRSKCVGTRLLFSLLLNNSCVPSVPCAFLFKGQRSDFLSGRDKCDGRTINTQFAGTVNRVTLPMTSQTPRCFPPSRPFYTSNAIFRRFRRFSSFLLPLVSTRHA